MTSGPRHRSTEAVFAAYAQHWADRDADAIAERHSTDTTYQLHHGREPVHGRASVRHAFATLFEQFTDFSFDVHRTIFGSRHWVLDWTLTCTLPGPEGTPRPARWDCLDIVTLTDDGLVARKDTYIDAMQLDHALRASTGNREP